MKHRRLLLCRCLVAFALLEPAARADDAAKARARQHFNQAVELFDLRRFADSLAEFERSYAEHPVYSTLYNIGEVHVVLGHSVEAVDAFEKFLAQGGASVSPEERERVEAELKLQRDRVGAVDLDASPEGAEVRLDGRVVGRAPVGGALKVSAGHHQIEVMLDGYGTELREIDVAGRASTKLVVSLRKSAPATASTAPTVPSGAAPQALDRASAQMPAVATQRDSAPTSPAAGSSQRIAGFGIGALGLVGAGAGAAIAIAGQQKHDDALAEWYAGNKPLARQTESDSAHQKTAGFVTMGIGGAVVIAGAVVVLTTPADRSARALAPAPAQKAGWMWTPWLADGAAGAVLRGTW